MMRPIFYFFIASIFTLCSCLPKNNKISQPQKTSIVGKWHRFSFRNGYTEFDIDSQYVVFFNQKTGRIKLGYKIENDSFKYIGHNYAAKFIDYGDSIFFKGNDSSTATLYRFNETDIPFDDIPEEKYSLLFESYFKGYDQRMIAEYRKAGIMFSDENEKKDTAQTFQQLLNNKKH
jgi:hypothetical protein